jgi:hypothetical protein
MNQSLLEKDIVALTEIEKCTISPLYFLQNYVYLQNRAGTKTEKWKSWDYLEKTVWAILTHNEINIWKSRQLGISWLTMGLTTWVALFHENAKVLLLSQGETEAFNLIGKCRFIYNHLPDFMRIKLGHDSSGLLDFPANQSEIVALPSTANAGRSTDATWVVQDELEFHPYAWENTNAVQPTIEAGGKIIRISTVNKMISREKSLFQTKWIDCYEGKTNGISIFLGAELRPVRIEGLTFDEWWEREIVPKYTELNREQEHPRTLKDALKEVHSRMYFDAEVTDLAIQSDCLSPLNDDLTKQYSMIKIFKKPIPGEKYVCFTDPSDGKEDPHATIVLCPRTGDQMAESHGKVPADQCAVIHDALVRYYNNAHNSWESNAFAGGTFTNTIISLKTPNQQIQKKGKEDRHGMWTSDTHSKGGVKSTMLSDLERAFANRAFVPHSKDCLIEMKNFIVPEGQVYPEAKPGCHDDYIMACAGAWQLSKAIPRWTVPMTSFQYRDGQGG